jgi:hypothetical protein
MLYYAMKNEDIFVKIKQEVKENPNITFENLKNLKYIDALYKETLRYYG